MVNSKQSSTRSKSRPKTAVRTRKASVQDTPPTQSQLDEELGSVKKGITKLENKITSIEKYLLDPDDVSAKLVELEDRSRRNNLRIDGLQETPNEPWKTCKEKVQEILNSNLGFATKVEIDRCHRVKSRH